VCLCFVACWPFVSFSTSCRLFPVGYFCWPCCWNKPALAVLLFCGIFFLRLVCWFFVLLWVFGGVGVFFFFCVFVDSFVLVLLLGSFFLLCVFF